MRTPTASRAYVRHEVIPHVKERSPQLLEVLGRTMNLIADEDDMLEEMAYDLVKRHMAWNEALPDRPPAYDEGGVLAPELGTQPVPLQRRAAVQVLQAMLGPDARVETASVDAVLAAWDEPGTRRPPARRIRCEHPGKPGNQREQARREARAHGRIQSKEKEMSEQPMPQDAAQENEQVAAEQVQTSEQPMTVDVILASGSPRRKELLEREGVSFTIRVSEVDESLEPDLRPTRPRR